MSCGDASLVRIDDHELAKVVERARMEVLLMQPSLASAVMRVPVVQVSSDRLPSGIGVSADGLLVSQALRLVQPPLVAYAYAHNLVHVLFEHVDRRQTREPETWSLAIDIATASLIDPLLDPAVRAECAESDTRPEGSAEFKALVKAHESHSCEEIYDALDKRNDDGPARSSPQSNGSPLGFEGETGRTGHAYEITLGLSEGVACSAEDRQLLMQEIAEAMQSEGMPGTVPGQWQELAQRVRSRPVPWERVFAERLGGLVPTDYQTYPFSKRHLWRGVYLPSLARAGIGRIVFAIDTSGSMNLALLGRITDQIDQLRQATMCALTIVHFDASIQRVTHFDEFSDPIERNALSMPGRGGTDIRAPFEYLANEEKRGEQLAGIIVATDGCGPLPTKEPTTRTIWLVPDGWATRFQPPFGTVIPCEGGNAGVRTYG